MSKADIKYRSTQERRRSRRNELLAVFATIAATLGFIIFAGVQQADAHQPYGGCKEAWRYSTSSGAAHCRSHGWVVRPNVVIGPHGWVHVNRLRPLPTDEPNRRGYWNARTMGNQRGDSFVVIGRDGHLRAYYVAGFTR